MKKCNCTLKLLILSACIVICGCVWYRLYTLSDYYVSENSTESGSNYEHEALFAENIPEYAGVPYAEINNNIPWFKEDDYTEESFEMYSELDALGRCGVAFACLSQDTMPKEERESIGSVKPSGWHTVKYDCVEGKYLYNRCHLIAYQLSGENSNVKNLITGTRYMNVEGMLPFEIKVIDYVENTGHHVLYRVTPLYEGENLLAKGVLMEALSVEDEGEGICFNIFVYNVQPGVEIDYAAGESRLLHTTDMYSGIGLTHGEDIIQSSEFYLMNDNFENVKYIINTNSKKFHYLSCESVSEMSERNKRGFNGNREELIEQGYIPCRICQP